MLRNGLKSQRLKKTPLLLKWHRDERLKFIRQHKEKENSFWERVLWIDETKIELFGHNHRNYVWRKDGAYSPKNTVSTVKFGGGSIMIWGCFSAKGVGKISVIDGKMNAKSIDRSYKKIWCLLLRVLSYLLISFSSRIMIPSTQLNLQRSGCLKIMLIFCNSQVSPQIWIQLGTCNFWKFKSKKEHQQTSMIWRQKYQLIIARNYLTITERD